MSKLHQTQQNFYVHFRTARAAIEALITTDPVPDPPTDLLESAESRLASLRSDVANAKAYLAPYDQRTYSTQLDQLTADYDALRAKLAPTASFSFSSRSRKPGENGSVSSDSAQSETPSARPSLAESSSWTSSESTHTTLLSTTPTTVKDSRLPPSVSTSVYQIRNQLSKFVVAAPLPSATSLLVSGIEDCVVYIPPFVKVSSVQVMDCANSVLIFAGVIDGPIHLTRVVTCSLVVRDALQFRMHDSTDSDILLGSGITSAIIEKSDELIFAQATFDSDSDDKLMSAVSPYTGKVDDFDHPALPASPNWNTIDDDSTTKFTEKDFKTIVEIANTAGSTTTTALSADALRIKRKALSRGFDFDD
ncbi:hypothetical protein BZA70DRAFT_280486 [Myxozyma melibiosi]|uniref:C-CAP/cofactor C-like domain-containing protein n=1 Tax=Myxozyma melibiosi TaxID=54550 RepID=A0ABR1F3A5_9ASCO